MSCVCELVRLFSFKSYPLTDGNNLNFRFVTKPENNRWQLAESNRCRNEVPLQPDIRFIRKGSRRKRDRMQTVKVTAVLISRERAFELGAYGLQVGIPDRYGLAVFDHSTTSRGGASPAPNKIKLSEMKHVTGGTDLKGWIQ